MLRDQNNSKPPANHFFTYKKWLTELRSSKISGRKHFSNKWIEGAESVRIINIRDNANADQHIHAMEIEQREQAQAKGQSLVVPSGSILKHFPRLQSKNVADLRSSLT